MWSTLDFDLGDRGQAFVKLLGDGIFTQDGAKWKHSRALLRPHFSKQRTDIFDSMRTRCQDLVNSLEDGTTVDLQPHFFHLTLDVSLFFLFGESWTSIASREHSLSGLEFLEAFNRGIDFVSASAKLAGQTWLVENAKSRKACATVHRYIDEAVEKAMKLADEGGVTDQSAFVYHLLQETRDRKVLRDQTLNILGAARDTTAGTLSWAL